MHRCQTYIWLIKTNIFSSYFSARNMASFQARLYRNDTLKYNVLIHGEATGVDLQMPTKKKKRVTKKVKKFPGLTDIKSKQNTVTRRLEKKVFTKSAMKRVAIALDKLDHRRFRDKYGDQFHYMYDTA